MNRKVATILLTSVLVYGCAKNEINVAHNPDAWEEKAYLEFEVTDEGFPSEFRVWMQDRDNCVKPLERTHLLSAAVSCPLKRFLGCSNKRFPEEPIAVPSGPRVNLYAETDYRSSGGAKLCRSRVRSFVLEKYQTYRLVLHNYHPAQGPNCSLEIIDSNDRRLPALIQSYPDCPAE